ncbi:peptidase [Bifidobacterium aquikefiricola]|uniref:Peptidase n=1 Tax=Bifidobacterium aquikefiricola TaxID=3059038 RepID=A0AB39U5M7_9BIFI
MHRQHKRRLGRLYTLVFACASLLALALTVPALAQDGLRSVGEEWYVPYTFDGYEVSIGAMAESGDGRKVYCMETGQLVSYDVSHTQSIPDSQLARSIAWLTQHYRNTAQALTHAGIGIIIHDAYDLNPETWKLRKQTLQDTHPETIVKAQQLLAEATNNTATGASLNMSYEVGKRRGYIDVMVKGPEGVKVPDVPFTLKLDGPAVFVAGGTSTFSGKSSSTAQRIYWTATGTGNVKATVSYEYGTIEQLVSNQDYVRFATVKSAAGASLNFAARKEFAPTVSTTVPHGIIDEGDQILDTVTSGISAGDVWEQGVRVKALGYYFDTLKHDDLGNVIHPQGNESVKAYLERLSALGHRPSAYGNAQFDAPNRSVQVRATTQPDGNEPYLASADSGIGTWVWVIDHSQQETITKEFVVKDVLSDFLEIPETMSIRRKLSVDSSVTEHAATVGSELSDVISISGFHADNGAFKGNTDYGLQADLPHAEVQVFWSGSGDGGDDEPYKPTASDLPQLDDHHELVGSWKYPATNRTIKVGAGAPDMLGEPVHIIANKPGYYVFVYAFSGDARTAPIHSSYSDAWERVRVQAFAEPLPAQATIETHAEPSKVKLGESSYDMATITGTVPEGSYMTFSAFASDRQTETIDVDKPVLDELRVDLAANVASQTVTSSRVTASHAGSLQWKATLWTADGTILDSHELGLKEETTTVVSHAPKDAEAEPGKSERRPAAAKELAHTGVSILVVFGVPASIALISGMVMVSIARVRREK